MGFHEHSLFDVPPHETTIWRYMNLGTFLRMLESSTLFFTRTDCFSDPFEGAVPDINVLRGAHTAEEITAARMRTVANCWHISRIESDALWRLYSSRGETLAIRSTVQHLIDGVAQAPHPIYVSRVQYIDYRKDGLKPEDELFAFLFKRSSFCYESELRAVIATDPEPTGTGISVPVDLDILVRIVYVAPTASDWLAETVATVADRLGL